MDDIRQELDEAHKGHSCPFECEAPVSRVPVIVCGVPGVVYLLGSGSG